ncbi:MAG TPA: hypothetical protein VEV41_28320 [Terriglobales bacterium]|nr:hypothetical protein [Terriglobales bacterium]
MTTAFNDVPVPSDGGKIEYKDSNYIVPDRPIIPRFPKSNFFVPCAPTAKTSAAGLNCRKSSIEMGQCVPTGT